MTIRATVRAVAARADAARPQPCRGLLCGSVDFGVAGAHLGVAEPFDDAQFGLLEAQIHIKERRAEPVSHRRAFGEVLQGQPSGGSRRKPLASRCSSLIAQKSLLGGRSESLPRIPSTPAQTIAPSAR